MHTDRLLEESQQMQEEMVNQEKVMKQGMEEIRANQEQMEVQDRELKKVYESTKENQRQLELRIMILDKMCLVSITEKIRVITEVNPKLLEVDKYDESELIGQPHNIVRH